MTEKLSPLFSMLESLNDARKSITPEKLTPHLKRLGFATRDEVAALEARIELLEQKLASKNSQL